MALALRAYWKHDETGTGTRADATGNGQTLTNNNSVTNGTGILNNASAFTRASSMSLSRADEAQLRTGDIDCFVSVWVKFTTLVNFEDMIAKWGGSTNEFDLEIGSSGVPTFYYGTGSATWGAALSTGTWYNIVGYHDSVNNKVGIVVNAGTPVLANYTLGNTAGNSPFVLGAQGAAGIYLDGLLDEVAFGTGVPSGTDLTNIYGGGTPPAYGASWPAGAASTAPFFNSRFVRQAVNRASTY